MRYLKLNEDDSIVYPYSIQDLKNANSNTSFPERITDELLLTYNVHVVILDNTPTDYTKNYTEGTPVLVDGQYYQNWIVTDATPEEIQQRLDGQWSVIRSQRNEYLSECDWTQLPDSPLTPEKKEEWAVYRQELRDVTSQPDPFNITWPTKPE